jgi:hypothetical protein
VSGKRSSLQIFLVALLLAAAISAFTFSQERSRHTLVGDGWFYAATSISLLQDGDLELDNQLRGPVETFSTHLALGRKGQVYPKHPVLMPLVSVPFLALLGMRGFLVVNLLAAAAAGTLAFATARRLTSGGAALAACLAVLFCTFVPWYFPEYSPDVFSAALVLGGICLLLSEKPRGADGLLLALAVLAKPLNVLFWGWGVLHRVWSPDRRALLLYLLLSLPPLLALGGLNAWMFGSPLTTGYDRILVAEDGEWSYRSQREDFDLPILDGMRGQLLDRQRGLLPTSPILLLAIPGWVALLRRDRRAAMAVLVPSLLLFLLLSTYTPWDQSSYGNRFLMAPVLLAALPIAAGLEWALARVRRRFAKTEE